ncbi:MAG: RNA-guided endonuclease InsQ/TnpB family protein [Actinoallomurus sp.]
MALLEQCGHARYVWSLAVEQYQHWRPGRVGAAGYAEQSRQLTEARKEFGWLAAGSQAVQQQVLPGRGQVVGVDCGVVVSAALSTGTLLSVPGLCESEAKRLLRLQRRLARAKRGSNLGRRVKAAIGRMRARETDRRRDWVEQTSRDLARRLDLVRVEDLKIWNMVRSARGAIAAPGRNVRAKPGLNRSIHAAGWGHLVTRSEDKAAGRVERIDPAFTFQICHACGHCDARNRESQAVFRCRVCGHAGHADVNAAKNIAVGRTVTARGALQPLGGAVNREPQPVLTSA